MADSASIKKYQWQQIETKSLRKVAITQRKTELLDLLELAVDRNQEEQLKRHMEEWNQLISETDGLFREEWRDEIKEKQGIYVY